MILAITAIVTSIVTCQNARSVFARIFILERQTRNMEKQLQIYVAVTKVAGKIVRKCLVTARSYRTGHTADPTGRREMPAHPHW